MEPTFSVTHMKSYDYRIFFIYVEYCCLMCYMTLHATTRVPEAFGKDILPYICIGKFSMII